MTISVVIPVLNGEKTLSACLHSIRNQLGVGEVEIIVLDSMSTDGSREIASSFGAIIIDIAAGTFNHGLTRNIGVARSTGDLVFMTVQDARLSGEYALFNMMRYFNDDKVMGVVGHQAVPHERYANPLYWYRPQSIPVPKFRETGRAEDMETWSQQKKREMFAWDDVVAMYRKSALEELPFVRTDFAEDWIWSATALKKGWCLVYDPGIVTFHYHHRTFNYVFRSHLILHHHLYAALGIRPICPNIFWRFIWAFYHYLRISDLKWKEKFYWLVHEFNAQLADLISCILFQIITKAKGLSGSAWLLRRFVKTIPQGFQMINTAIRT